MKKYIKDHSKDNIGLMMSKLSSLSKMTTVPDDKYYALDKVEEELIECFSEVRRLKKHYDTIKVARKSLNDDTYKATLHSLIEEMGDVFVDLFLYLPSVIDIDNDLLNERIEKKIAAYEKVLVYGYKVELQKK
jgi:NTP pyrophosphatase (non-canonical NTP hydrolase)